MSNKTGEMQFTGPSARFSGSISAEGLSAGDKPAHNLRGKNVEVKAGESSVKIAFATPEEDGEYAVFIEQNWLSNRAVTAKDADGFTVSFDKPAGEGAKIDWMIVR